MTARISKPFLKVLQAGPQAQLQDAGRYGVRHLGITQGGPADWHAWAWANRLVNNAWGTAALEILLGGGLQLEAQADCWLAVTGADLQATLDGQALPLWQRHFIRAGQQLEFAYPRQGLRAYLAVQGGFLAKQSVLGSVACVSREELGGHQGQGQSLQTGDALYFQPHPQQPPACEQTPLPPDYSAPAWLHLLPGAQISQFTGLSLFRAFNEAWQVDARADRMGVRLIGPELVCRQPRMISEGIALGGVQVPADGQPFVLLNDRQTIGGYPRLGNLTPLACSRLAQCAPGSRVYLRAQGLDQAQKEYRSFLQSFQ